MKTDDGAGREEPTIRLRNVARWYGEVLGVNKVTVDVYAGITGLLGPNGSGKTTLMNVVCGLLRPGGGSVSVLGYPVWNNPRLRRLVGYCPQADQLLDNFTGRAFLQGFLNLHGRGVSWARRCAMAALERVGLEQAARQSIATYSKGMRQRLKVALALAHEPEVLVLDEPFNGLDPIARREMMRLFIDYARQGRTLLIASHILHEVEQLTHQILMMSNGYVLAEGQVEQVRGLLRRHPFQVYLRCDRPRELAALMLGRDGVLRAEIEDDRALTLWTRDPDDFYLRLNRAIVEQGFEVDLVTLADENVHSIYRYLSGREHH